MQEIEKGKVISCGVQLGASYVAKNIPHVPYEQRNKEMYPIIQARSTLLEDLLGVCGNLFQESVKEALKQVCLRREWFW